MPRTIDERVRNVVAAELGFDVDARIASDALLTRELGADSNDLISLTLALEDEFAIEIPDDDAERLTTVREVIGYITQRVGTAAA